VKLWPRVGRHILAHSDSESVASGLPGRLLAALPERALVEETAAALAHNIFVRNCFPGELPRGETFFLWFIPLSLAYCVLREGVLGRHSNLDAAPLKN